MLEIVLSVLLIRLVGRINESICQGVGKSGGYVDQVGQGSRSGK